MNAMKNKNRKTKANIRRIAAKAVSGILAASAAFALLVFVPRTESYAGNANTQKYEEQIQELEKTQKELLAKINSLENEASATLENKQYMDSLVTTISTKIQTAEALCSELEAQIAQTQADIEEHEKLIDASTEKIKERMRANHEEGNASYLSV